MTIKNTGIYNIYNTTKSMLASNEECVGGKYINNKNY